MSTPRERFFGWLTIVLAAAFLTASEIAIFTYTEDPGLITFGVVLVALAVATVTAFFTWLDL